MDQADFDARFLSSYNKIDKSSDATEWLPSVVLLHRKCTDEDIANLEKKFEITLPADYKTVLKLHQGHRPMQRTFAYQIITNNKWKTTEMGPLWHCLDDCDEDFLDYHIATYSNNKKWTKAAPSAKQLAIGETSNSYPICINLESGIVIVLDEEGIGLAGENFTDFLWRMRLENANILHEKQQEYYCDQCETTIPKDQPRHSCKSCKDYDLCDTCFTQKTFRHNSKHTFTRKVNYDNLLLGYVPYRSQHSEEFRQYESQVNERRKTGRRIAYGPWEDWCYEKFPQLLHRNLRENLVVRADYYSTIGYLKKEHRFVVDIITDRHSVWLPRDPIDQPNFAYTIGVYYLFNQPEILLISEDRSVTCYELGVTLNAIRTYVMGDNEEVKAGTEFKELVEHCKEYCFVQYNFEDYAHCTFEEISDKESTDFMGYCTWFYCNFMDTLPPGYPVLVCKFNKKQ